MSYYSDFAGVDHILAVPSGYSTISVALAAIPSDLNAGGVGGDRWWIQCAAGSRAGVEITAKTNADATHFIQLGPAPGVTWDTLIITGHVEVRVPYTYCHDFKLTNSKVGNMYSSATNAVFENVQASGSFYTAFSAQHSSQSFIKCRAILSATSVGFSLNNAQVIGCSVKITGTGSRGFLNGVVNNCWCEGVYTSGCFQNSQAGSSNNWSTDATAPGANSIINGAVADLLLTDYTNNDFRTAAGSPLQRAGIDSALYTTDADGVAIPAGKYPIGAFYTPQPPDAPVSSSPADNATGAAINVTLDWNASAGAVSYQLQVATDVGFSSLVYNTAGLTSTAQAMSGLANNTLYYWRVNATSGAGTSAYSTARSFTTIAAVTASIFNNSLSLHSSLHL